MSSAYVPISRIEQGYSNDPKDFASMAVPLFWNMPLPDSLDKERICINSRQLNVLHRVGHLAGSVVNSYEGEQSTYTIESAKLNFDGSATAIKAKVKNKARLSKGSTSSDEGLGRALEDVSAPVAIHGLNRFEIISKVVDLKNERSLSSEQAWAAMLNTSLSASFSEAARKSLITRNYYKFSRTVELGFIGGALFSAVVSKHYDSALFNYACFESTSVLFNYAYAKLGFGKNILSQKAWSLAFYSHPDRYLVFEALKHTGPLIKVKK